jgi:hypothetical protein
VACYRYIQGSYRINRTVALVRMPIKRYIAALVITITIFVVAFAVSDYVSSKRVQQVQDIEDNISVNILALETQFDLLAEQSCTDIGENSVLSDELSTLGDKLSFMESSRGATDPEVMRLKRYYSLLEIKDLLLMQKVAQKCNLKPVFMLYFYSNENDCPDCQRQGYVLSALAREYPRLRIYSFDYHLDLSVVRTLINLRNIPDTLPAIVVGKNVYNGFQSVEAIEQAVPELEDLKDTPADDTKSTTQQ